MSLDISRVRKGDRVVFAHPQAGYPEDAAKAKQQNLVPGKTYIVKKVVVHNVVTDLHLEWAEQLSPGPYLELFARRPRAGWTTLGDEL